MQIIPKKIEKVSSWEKYLFQFFLSLFLILILVSVFLFIFEKRTEIKIGEIKEKIKSLENPQNLETEKTVLTYQKKIEDFKKVLSQHSFPSKLFPFLESKTLSGVVFSKMDVDLVNSKVSLSGQAENFPTLGQQILVLKEEPLVKELSLKNVSLSEEKKVKFDLEITLDQKIFQYGR
jgi:cell division protein FtsL